MVAKIQVKVYGFWATIITTGDFRLATESFYRRQKRGEIVRLLINTNQGAQYEN